MMLSQMQELRSYIRGRWIEWGKALDELELTDIEARRLASDHMQKELADVSLEDAKSAVDEIMRWEKRPLVGDMIDRVAEIARTRANVRSNEDATKRRRDERTALESQRRSNERYRELQKQWDDLDESTREEITDAVAAERKGKVRLPDEWLQRMRLDLMEGILSERMAT